MIGIAEIEQRFWIPGLAEDSRFLALGRSHVDVHWDP
jgi:hypothetical protein